MPFLSDIRVAVLIAGLLTALPGLTAPALANDAKAAAQAAADCWDQSFNSGDTDELARLYGTNAEVVTKGALLSGGPSIRTYFTNLKTKGFADHKVMVQSAKTKGNLLIANGRWEASGPGDGGGRKVFSGNWVNVLERQGDGWRTVLHTWN